MIYLQNSNSPIMEQLIFFHDHALLILMMITILVGYIMYSMLLNLLNNSFFTSWQFIEIIWTIFPAIILLFIAFPSLRLLYLLDESFEQSLTIKTVGHQWYWSYEYSNFSSEEFESRMIDINSDYISKNISKNNYFRLLDTDHHIIVPHGKHVRMLITAADVIHSWTIPSIGVKVDAVPGRLNQTNFYLNRPGMFFGQCSEICGVNHSFMPIHLESISWNTLTSYSWL